MDDPHAADVQVAVTQSLGQVGDGPWLICKADEHCVLLDWVPSGVVQDVQHPFVMIRDKGDFANVINFLGVECFGVDLVPGKGRGKAGSQSVVIFRDDGNLFHGLEKNVVILNPFSSLVQFYSGGQIALLRRMLK